MSLGDVAFMNGKPFTPVRRGGLEYLIEKHSTGISPKELRRDDIRISPAEARKIVEAAIKSGKASRPAS